ncbi:MAG TPA: gephyrin-like molybdotransferase Glp [Terriglobales bacterium]|jgi:molybdopterin molybdotransferase|nr:gephyrin-like molybdotransferase Glp [Terriglobales bacterium]
MGATVHSKLLSFSDARHLVEEYASTVSATSAEMLPLLDANGLVLAEELRADRDFPPFPRSTRDGFAVRAADVAGTPARLRCIAEIRAGATVDESSIVVGQSECAEIMTGAPVPEGANAVVMVEHTERSGESVILQRSVVPGENVVLQGSEARQGATMVAPGVRVNHTITAIAAAIGRPEIAVHRRPRVAILATGDEVVDVNLRPRPNEIRNSNSYSLAAQVQLAGGEPMILPVARDEADDLALLLRKGLEADLLLITGGVSMGKYDLVEQVLASFEASFFFTGAKIQPGKPVVFGECKSAEKVTPFFGLPGNPVSTMVTFQLFVRPLLDGLSGSKPQPLPFAQAALKSEFTTRTGLTRFLPARLLGSNQKPEVEVIRWQGSGDLMAASQANCYLVVPPERERFSAGETMTILLL